MCSCLCCLSSVDSFWRVPAREPDLAELNLTQPDLNQTQSDLNQTQHDLNLTSTRPNMTSTRPNLTQPALNLPSTCPQPDLM